MVFFAVKIDRGKTMKMTWDEATDDAGRCVLCGGEVTRDYDPEILKHYGEQDEVIVEDDGVEITLRSYKCQSCGNESCEID